MNATAIIQLYVFVLAGFVGFLVITRVPPLLHTPLMSATNAISAISLVGSLVVAGANRGTASTVLGFIAVIAGAGWLLEKMRWPLRKAGPTPKGVPCTTATPSASKSSVTKSSSVASFLPVGAILPIVPAQDG